MCTWLALIRSQYCFVWRIFEINTPCRLSQQRFITCNLIFKIIQFSCAALQQLFTSSRGWWQNIFSWITPLNKLQTNILSDNILKKVSNYSGSTSLQYDTWDNLKYYDLCVSLELLFLSPDIPYGSTVDSRKLLRSVLYHHYLLYAACDHNCAEINVYHKLTTMWYYWPKVGYMVPVGKSPFYHPSHGRQRNLSISQYKLPALHYNVYISQ